MSGLTEAISALDRMKTDGVIQEYAVGGAMALVFWAEPIPTFDLDVFVVLSNASGLISLAPIYEWTRRNGFPEEAEHILMGGVPVQLIPAPNRLAEEAIDTAATLDYSGRPVRVIRPEYLIAMYLESSARTRKRLERVAALLEEGKVDETLLHDVLGRYELRLPSYE